VATLTDAIRMVQKMGAELRAVAADARDAADAVQEYGLAEENEASRSTTSAMTKAPGSGAST
jgi:hypothetical protein